MGDISQHIRNWENCLIGKDRSQMTQQGRIERLLERLRPRRFYNHVPVDGWQIAYAMYHGMDDKGKGKYTWLRKDLKLKDANDQTSYATCDKPQWQPIGLDQSWGDLFVTAFLKTDFTVPKEFNGQKMYMLFFVGGDGMLNVNGQGRQGVDCFHTELWMADLAKGGRKLKFEVETFQKHEVDVERYHDLMISDMALLDEDVEGLYWDMYAALSAAQEEHAPAETRDMILHHLDEALKIVDVFEPDQAELRKGAKQAAAYLTKNLLNDESYQMTGKVAAVGHSHLDIVYKWEYDEYLRKINRTHTTQLRLMDEFDGFKFSQSQAITYIEMQRLYPDLFKQIQQAVKKGSWEILGICFSESDCYLPGGESHVRNIMMGKRFFEKEFNVRPKVAWQCDLFGVAWSLPQIYKKCGVDYFVTHKMGVWNSDNDWPYNIYWWEGVDGTKMLAHTPSSHIIQTCEGSQLQSHWKNFGEKVQCGESLYTYGWGDGGSGVMRDMIHRAKRYKQFPGVPEVSFERAEDFFARVNKRVSQRNDLPIWSNELYVETHRGQYTTQGYLKWLNRRAEVLFRNAEWALSTAAMLGLAKYDNDKLNAGWVEILKAHFHDGVTGTHVPKAYEEMKAFYHNAMDIANDALDTGLGALVKKIDTRGEGEPVVLFNSHTWTRCEPMQLPYRTGVKVVDNDGNEFLSQVIERNGQKQLWAQVGPIPACGYKVARLVKGKADRDAGGLKVSPRVLENDKVKVKLDNDGHVVSFYDKAAKRETIEKGALANEFQLFEDIAGYYEAWDLHKLKDVHQWPARKADSIKVVEEGPLRVAIEVVKTISNSKLTQRIVLWRHANYVDFETTVDWDEEYKILKVAFPIDIQTFTCQYDIAFGNMPRATHRTTSWEQTKFEVPAHKWADLSDAGYGVSLINDCKYGYDCEKNVLRLSLLRAPKYPNPESDIYTHHFTYRLLAHEGDWRRGGTIRNAWQLNDPVKAIEAKPGKGELGDAGSLMGVEGESVILEAVKKAEDSDEMIVRLVEHWGQQTTVKVTPPAGATTWQPVNPVEESEGKAKKVGKSVSVTLKPYEIVSLKFNFAK